MSNGQSDIEELPLLFLRFRGIFAQRYWSILVRRRPEFRSIKRYSSMLAVRIESTIWPKHSIRHVVPLAFSLFLCTPATDVEKLRLLENAEYPI